MWSAKLLIIFYISPSLKDKIYIQSANPIRFLEQRFPGIKIYFQCTGDGIWTTNDRIWKYSNRYYLDIEEEDEDYYDELTEVIAEVERVTGATGLQTLEDCEQALETYSDANGELVFNIGEFEIVD